MGRNNDRILSTHSTQGDAEAAAKRMLQKAGGGELITKGMDGKIRSKDTTPPKKDPYPLRIKSTRLVPLSASLIDVKIWYNYLKIF